MDEGRMWSRFTKLTEKERETYERGRRNGFAARYPDGTPPVAHGTTTGQAARCRRESQGGACDLCRAVVAAASKAAADRRRAARSVTASRARV